MKYGLPVMQADIFYAGETNSGRQESTFPLSAQKRSRHAACKLDILVYVLLISHHSVYIFENPSQRNANCHKPEARSSFILPGSKTRLVAVSLNNIDLVIVLSLHNFCRNGHGDSGNYQVPSYQGNRLLPNAHIATVVARLAAPRAPCRCG